MSGSRTSKSIIDYADSLNENGTQLKETPFGVRLQVTVQANAKKFAVQEKSGTWKIWVPKAAVDGKANQALLSNLQDILQCKIEIVSGWTSKQKILLIRGKPASELEALLKKASK